MGVNIGSIRNLLVDMDGVLYRGHTALPGAADLIAYLQERKFGYLLVTNNSTLTQAQFVARLAGMGMSVPEDRILTSGVATAAYLARRAAPGARVYVVGEQALVDELVKRGFVMGGRDSDYVVAGWDKYLTYDKLATATLAIRDGAQFIGTNPDKTYPLERDIVPGAGSIQAAITAATDVEPLIIGKPGTPGLLQALELLGGRPEDTAILGDRLDTDIVGGQQAGIHTILVLTGISTREEALACGQPPDLIYSNLPALLADWRDRG
ncbi:MAG: HAD-IIA family hydrolase [Chloroflexi bacterium]|nr:HAD-IIA family hydrolase [Chloroflexota bacterium]